MRRQVASVFWSKTRLKTWRDISRVGWNEGGRKGQKIQSNTTWRQPWPKWLPCEEDSKRAVLWWPDHTRKYIAAREVLVVDTIRCTTTWSWLWKWRRLWSAIYQWDLCSSTMNFSGWTYSHDTWYKRMMNQRPSAFYLCSPIFWSGNKTLVVCFCCL